ncbi:hypothetical protein Tco_0828348, partial [Tanacetum coccineum]
IIIIDSYTSLSSGSSSSDEYDSHSSYDTSSLDVYEIVSSKGIDKKLLKWYEDAIYEDIAEFKFLKPIFKGKASSSITPCDDTSNKEFTNDDDDNGSDEDFPELKLRRPKLAKSPSLDSSDEDIPNSSKSQAKTSKGKYSYSTADEDISQAITLKSSVPQPIIMKSTIAIKNCVIGLVNGKT